MPDRLTPDPNLSPASVLDRVGRQFPRQVVSHLAVFPPDDFPFLLGLPGYVIHLWLGVFIVCKSQLPN